MEVDTGSLIGAGESADVYRQDGGTILKLFFPHVALHTVEREYAASAAADALDLLVARPIAIVRVGDRHGLIMRFLNGPVYLRRVAKSPVGMTWALLALVRWQVRQHARPAPPVDIPEARQIFAHRLVSSVAGPAAIAVAQRVVAAYPDDRVRLGPAFRALVFVFTGIALLAFFLLLMTVLPICLFAKEPVQLRVTTGGTDTTHAPTTNYLRNVFLAALKKMGVEAELTVQRYGY